MPSPFECRVLAAVGACHGRTGAAVMVHLEHGSAAFEVLDVLDRHGVPASAVVLAHVDRNPDPGLHAELAAAGAYLGYDGFARSQRWPDAAIIDCLRASAENGAGDRIVLGGDVARRSRYRGYGGMPGMAYLGQRVLPRLERETSAGLVHKVSITNPARWLSGTGENDMTDHTTIPVPPVILTPRPDEGRLEGGNARYEKRLADLAGVYRDQTAYRAVLGADDGAPVYWVESSTTENGSCGLITGISVLEPGRVGDEYAMTRGHLHAISDRSELYVGLAGRGVMILETVDGRSEVVDVEPGRAVYVPGNWVHRSVNVGRDRFSTLFCYAADAGQDYAIIERAGGMASLVVAHGDGYTVRANPDHRGYTLLDDGGPST